MEKNVLEWVLNHFIKYYDSDFFPRSFEYPILLLYIDELFNSIGSITNYESSNTISMVVPKTNASFRIVHKLEPLDAIIYTAEVYNLRKEIEENRLNDKVACSYRINTEDSGFSFFKDTTGWDNFRTETNRMCTNNKDKLILSIDIADFYNHIYIHRVENHLRDLSNDNITISNIEKILISLGQKSSIGVPVGPAASIIVAEVILDDIDKYLRLRNYNFTRYVDDFNIIMTNRKEAETFLIKFTDYLYHTHRLSLAGEKTKLIPTEKYLLERFDDEKYYTQMKLIEKLEQLAYNKIIEEIRKNYPDEKIDFDEIINYVDSFDIYPFLDVDTMWDTLIEQTIENLSEGENFNALSESYTEIIEQNLHASNINYKIMKHVIKQCKKHRIKKPINIIIANFNKCYPIIREVSLYLHEIIDKKIIDRNRERFEEIIISSINFPYINEWIAYILQNKSFDKEFHLDYENILTYRNRFLLAMNRKDVQYIRSFRSKVHEMNKSDLRAYIYSHSIIKSRGELSHLKMDYDDPITRIIWKHIYSLNR